MTEQELKTRLRTAMEHAAPDDFEGVRARCRPRDAVSLRSTGGKRPRRWLPATVAACLLLAAAGGGAGYHVQNHTVASVISLDVNPGIQLKVNRKETVLSATPTNEDGVQILDDMDLKGAKVDVAMNAIVGSLLKHGYVDELANSILITVEDEDTVRGARLQQELTDEADAILASAQVNGAILSQTIQNSAQLQELSHTYGISVGKATLIQTIVEQGGRMYSFQDLSDLSINELNLLYSSGWTETQSVQTGPIQSTGQASDRAYIGMDAAKAAALRHAGLDAGRVQYSTSDYDYEDGRMVYELEFWAQGAEYEYDIDAITGAVVSYQWEGSPLPNVPSDTPRQPDTPPSVPVTPPVDSGTSGGSSGQTAADIGQEQAKNLALQHAGLTEAQVENLKVKRDLDDGRTEYEVEFYRGAVEYEYTIDASSGTILNYERDD